MTAYKEIATKYVSLDSVIQKEKIHRFQNYRPWKAHQRRRPMTEQVKFYPKEEEFPDFILCPLCKNQKYCGESGDKECKTIQAMCDDMQNGEGGFFK